MAHTENKRTSICNSLIVGHVFHTILNNQADYPQPFAYAKITNQLIIVRHAIPAPENAICFNAKFYVYIGLVGSHKRIGCTFHKYGDPFHNQSIFYSRQQQK